MANRCSRDNILAAEERAKAEEYCRQQKQLRDNEIDEINKKAEQMILHKVDELENDNEISKKKWRKYYASKYAAKESWHILAFVFCIVWLIIQALSSSYFRHEVLVVCELIKEYIVDGWGYVSSWSNGSGTYLAALITNSIASDIVFWIVFIIVGLLSALLFYGLPLVIIFGGNFIYLSSKAFDKENRWIMVGSAILFIAASSELSFTPQINLLLLWLIIQIAVPIIRYIIIPLIYSSIDKFQGMASDDRRNFYCNIMMVVAIIGVFISIMFMMRSCAADMARLSK